MSSMSTSHPSGPAKYTGAILLALAIASTSTSIRADGPPPSSAESPTMTKEVLIARLADALTSDDEFPDEHPLIEYERPVTASAATGSPLLIAFTVRYRNITNRYCRLAVSSTDAVQVIAIPPRVNFDTCRSNRPLRFVDVNGDGMVDVFYVATVNSNRGAINVAEVVAYVSEPRNGSPYCYSQKLSSVLEAKDLASDKHLVDAIASAKRRAAPTTSFCFTTEQ
jgi:hypothetical protein